MKLSLISINQSIFFLTFSKIKFIFKKETHTRSYEIQTLSYNEKVEGGSILTLEPPRPPLFMILFFENLIFHHKFLIFRFFFEIFEEKKKINFVKTVHRKYNCQKMKKNFFWRYFHFFEGGRHIKGYAYIA